jgi:hypothetical protein
MMGATKHQLGFKNGMHHRDRYQFAEVSYWRFNTASDKADAGMATLEFFGGYPKFDFTLPDDRFKLDRWLDFLSKAYERGESAARAEIRELINKA